MHLQALNFKPSQDTIQLVFSSIKQRSPKANESPSFRYSGMPRNSKYNEAADG